MSTETTTNYTWTPPELRGRCIFLPGDLALGDIAWDGEPDEPEMRAKIMARIRGVTAA